MRVPRPTECFIGKNGVQVKTCNECRAKDARQAQKPEVRERKNEFQRGKGYDAKHRAKKREENEEAYLAHNAAIHLEWAHRNPKKIKHQQNLTDTDPMRKFKALVTYVRQKHGDDIDNIIVFDDADAMQKKMTAPCHYCDYLPAPGAKLNGLDRQDPRGQYSDANTVSCCGVCNAMKLTFDAYEFLQGVRTIVNFRIVDVDVCSLQSRPEAFGGTAARRTANNDKKTSASLPVDVRIGFWAGQCYLCGHGPAFGIDRVDAAQPYSPDNCESCCTLCNYMKKDHTLDEFLGHLSRIYKHTSMWVLGDTRNVLSSIGGPRKPVVALGADGATIIVFPSSGCAATVLGLPSSRTIQSSAIECGKSVCGASWAFADASAYKLQHMTPETAEHLIRYLRNVRKSTHPL